MMRGLRTGRHFIGIQPTQYSFSLTTPTYNTTGKPQKLDPAVNGYLAETSRNITSSLATKPVRPKEQMDYHERTGPDPR